MKKAELTSKLESILVAHKIELSSPLASQLLELVQVSPKVSVEKDSKYLISLSNKEDMDKVIELSKNTNSHKELEALMIENDIRFKILDKVESYENNQFTLSYCLWFKQYRELGRFSLSKRSSNGVHYESYEAEKHWAEYGKRIKALEEEITMTKNAVIDEVFTPAEGKEKIVELETQKALLVEYRKNKVSITDLEIAYKDTFKHKEFGPQGTIATDTEPEVVEEVKPKTKKKAK